MKSQNQNVMIPRTTFVDLYKYFVLGVRTDEAEESIKKVLLDKLEASIRHDLYSRSKGASTVEEREEARLEYLERVGVPTSFRYRPKS